MSRCRSFLPDLMTVRAVMVRAATEKKWYSIDVNWVELDKKLQVLAPTGLTREQIWQHLFLTKHRQNPFVEGRYKGVDYEEVEQKWKTTKLYFRDYKRCTRPFSVNLEVAIRGFDIDNMAAQKAIDVSKALHARRWQTKMAPTVSRNMSSLTSVMVETSMRTLVPLPPTLFPIPRIGVMTTLWVTNSCGVVLDTWYQYTTWRSSTCECFGCLTFSPAFRAFHPTL